MKRAFLVMMLLLWSSTIVSGQSSLTIEGPTDTIAHDSIVELTTNVDIAKDADGLPSHTIEWTVPRSMREKSKYYYNDTVLALPSGCKDKEFVVEVRVTDWIKRRIEKAEFTIKVRGDPTVDPDPIEPPPPEFDFTTSPLYGVAKTELAKVQDPQKDKWSKNMSSGFGFVAVEIKKESYKDIDDMLVSVGKVNRGEMEGREPWPANSRANWVEFRLRIAEQLDQLESAGELKTVDDYWFHFKALELVLGGG